MTTPSELLARYTTQSLFSSFFGDKVGIINILSYADGHKIYDGTTTAYDAFADIRGTRI